MIAPQEALAALTALTALTSALTELGLLVRRSGCMLSGRRPVANTSGNGPSQAPSRAVLLAHNPGNRNRLWWWLTETDQPSAQWRPHAPATDVRATADAIARLLDMPPEGGKT